MIKTHPDPETVLPGGILSGSVPRPYAPPSVPRRVTEPHNPWLLHSDPVPAAVAQRVCPRRGRFAPGALSADLCGGRAVALGTRRPGADPARSGRDLGV